MATSNFFVSNEILNFSIFVAFGVLLSTLVLLFFSRRLLSRRRNGTEKLPLPPEVPGAIPFLGNVTGFDRRRPHLTLTLWAKKYGDIYRFRLFTENIVVLNSAELIRKALLEQDTIFAGRPTIFRIKYGFHFADDIIFGTYSARWQEMKRKVTATLKKFTSGLGHIDMILEKEMENMVELLEKQTPKDRFDPTLILQTAVVNAISATVIGRRYHHDDQAMHDYKTTTRLFSESCSPTEGLEIDLFPWLRFIVRAPMRKLEAAMAMLDGFIDKELLSVKNNYDPKNLRCFLDGLLKLKEEDESSAAPYAMTDNDIRAIFIDILISGTLTTSIALNAFVLLMAHHPQTQSQLQTEIDQQIASGRLPTLLVRRTMPLMEAAILETLRYLSHVPLSLPHSTIQDTNLSGYHIPSNTKVLLNFWNVHHDEKVWTDPWSFRIERFIKEDNLDKTIKLISSESILRKNLMPFGDGRRKCIGEVLARERLFLFATCLLQRFRIEPPEGEPLVSADPRLYMLGLILEPMPFKVCIAARKTTIQELRK